MAEETEVETNNEANLEGLANDTPDEIRNFVLANDVADKFTVMLKQKPDNGGTAQTLRCFTNWYPDVNTLGRQWGPGSYILVFSWRAENAAGKKEMVTRDYKIEMPDRAWGEEHELWLEEQAKKRREAKKKEWRDEAEQRAILGGNAQVTPPVSEFETMKKFLGMAKEMGVPIGGQVKPEKEKEKKSFTDRMIDAAPLITALGAIVTPVALALIQRPKKPEDNTLTNTLLTHVLNNKPAEDQTMKTVLPFILGSLKQVMDFKEAMEPEEKETMVEKILGKLAPMVPAVLAMATQPRAQVEQSATAKAAQALYGKDFQVLKENAGISVQKLDETYGFQQTNQILSVVGVERPPELAENFRTYPSKGFGVDGNPDDGRTPPPDAAPDTGTDETVID